MGKHTNTGKRRPPRLHPDKRLKDPTVRLGVSPNDVPPATPPEACAAWKAEFENETFSMYPVDEKTGEPQMGRPRIPINLDAVRMLGRLNPTIAEVAVFCGVSESTVNRRLLNDPEFARALNEGKGELKLSVRRKQLHAALVIGDWRALEWMGRQLLNQRKEPQGDAPNATQGKSPLLEQLERMEAAIKAQGEQAAQQPDQVPSDPAGEAVPEWRRVEP